ncbi:hypothetical protein G4B88_010273 [Cannabis sativa]|uniref:Uncharacterized protein n=1 Tax=Cannabis sativa TaxID=3483 RepID=A0A7J6I6Z0_CANSA|nr:hypothetical protein G4B88_010273 [Cannabis sativa]
MALNNCFTLVLFIAFAFMSIDNGLAARNLLQSTAPNLPKPNIPSIPSLPQPNLPTLPNGLTMPPLPSLPIGPTIPKLGFPPMPNMFVLLFNYKKMLGFFSCTLVYSESYLKRFGG